MLKFPSVKVENSNSSFDLESQFIRNGESCQVNLSILENNKSVGKRLLEAFGTDDKEFIAKILGFKTVGGLYKVLSGEREMDFVKLKIFRNHTKRTIDWLLTGELDDSSNDLPEINGDIINRLKTISKEQSRIIHGDAEVAGADRVEAMTLRLLVEFLLQRALDSVNLADGDLISKADRKRAEKFTFLANMPQSMDDRIREMIHREISGKGVSQVAHDTEFRDMIRDIVREEVGTSRKRAVYPLRVVEAADEVEETTRRKVG